MSSIALDLFLLFVFNLELSLEWLSVGVSVGAIYGSSSKTNNTLGGRIMLESTPILVLRYRFKQKVKNKRL